MAPAIERLCREQREGQGEEGPGRLGTRIMRKTGDLARERERPGASVRAERRDLGAQRDRRRGHGQDGERRPPRGSGAGRRAQGDPAPASTSPGNDQAGEQVVGVPVRERARSPRPRRGSTSWWPGTTPSGASSARSPPCPGVARAARAPRDAAGRAGSSARAASAAASAAAGGARQPPPGTRQRGERQHEQPDHAVIAAGEGRQDEGERRRGARPRRAPRGRSGTAKSSTSGSHCVPSVLRCADLVGADRARTRTAAPADERRHLAAAELARARVRGERRRGRT